MITFLIGFVIGAGLAIFFNQRISAFLGGVADKFKGKPPPSP